MEKFEEEAKKVFNEVDGPYISLTPLGEQKVEIIANSLRSAYAAGMERAAEIAESKDSLGYHFANAIRAEAKLTN